MSTTASGAPAVALDDELVAALARLGREADAVTVLTPATARKFDRLTLRVDLRGGAAVKARRLESAATVRELVRLRQPLGSAYTAVLEYEGRTLVEEWIEGVPLEDLRADEQRLEEAGALLGRLHGLPSGTTGELETGAFLAAAVNDLGECRSDGVLTEDEVHRLSEMVHRLDPGSTPQALIHRDFCAENIVIDSDGALRVIDNEWVAVGPPGLDLGRTRSRWPMSGDGWTAFVAGYRAVRPIDEETLLFWSVAVAAWSIRLRLGWGPAAVAVPLEVLRTALEESS
jgi:aminoglycoside phosphotransferase (APT) family kinase protein